MDTEEKMEEIKRTLDLLPEENKNNLGFVN